MADINIILSGNDFTEFLKRLENGGLGDAYVYHDAKKLHGGVFPYGYRDPIHSWVGDEWRDRWASETMSDDTKAYDETDGWSDEAAGGMLEELINAYLTPELNKLANDTFTSQIELTQRQWDAIASVAWNIGVSKIKPLFEILDKSQDIAKDGYAWIVSQTDTNPGDSAYARYIKERRKCEAAWWNGEEPQFNEVDSTVQHNPTLPNYTPSGGNGNTIERRKGTSLLRSHMSVLYELHNGNRINATNLFSSKLYYLQNEGVEEDAGKERSDCSKALLYLHTLPFKYNAVKTKTVKSFFNDSDAKHGGRELIPMGIVVFIGGLIWRKRWSESHNGEDPIRYSYNTNAVYKKPANPFDPLLIPYNGELVFASVDSLYSVDYKTKYSDIVNENMDLYTENRLVYEFMTFVDGAFKDITKSCELKYCTPNQPVEETVIGTGVTYNPDQSEITGLSASSVKTMKFSQYREFEKALKSLKTLPEMLELLHGIKKVDPNDGSNGFYLCNFKTNYAMGFYNQSKDIIQTFFSDDNTVHEYFTALYKEPVYAMTIGHNVKHQGASGKLKKKYYEDYLEGFTSVLAYYAKRQFKQDYTDSKAGTSDKIMSRRELNLALYTELKNIWDRWICGYYNSDVKSDRDYFNVITQRRTNDYQNTMYGNFVFIDSFYCNIGHLLRLNCDKLLKRYQSDIVYDKKGNRNRVNVHLGNVASDHKCVMYNFPDYVGFTNGNFNDIKGTMENLFLPMPMSKIDLPNVMNKFVIIYANFAGMNENDHTNSFNKDGFNIYSLKDGTNVAPSIFNKSTPSSGLFEKPRMGYSVPSFCVEYSRQNNSYWKNISVSMENNANTSQAVLAYSLIAEKGNNSKRQVCFYGQDIYPIHQAYSYFVTIEMMGNAQIQPLMYFQLLNIPMFNGAYMVIDVTHEMTPGNMKTIIKGVKMSKVRMPFTKKWFSISEPGGMGDSYAGASDYANNTEDGDGLVGEHGEYVDIADNNLESAIKSMLGSANVDCDIFVKKVFASDGIDVHIQNKLMNSENNMFTELSNNTDDWEVHQFATPARQKNKWKPLFTGDNHPRCGDLLFCMHDGREPDQKGTFHHVAIYLGHSGERSSKMFVAEGNSVGGSMFVTSPTRVHVCAIEDSKMGLQTDLITHWARCKKYEVAQKGDTEGYDTDPRIVFSEVYQDDIYHESESSAMTQYPYNASNTGQTTQAGPGQWVVVNNTASSRNYYVPSGKTHYVVGNFQQPKISDTLVANTSQISVIINNMKNLIDKVLNPAADIYLFENAAFADKPLKAPKVTSLYRNKVINGNKQSQHLKGEAADLQCSDTNNMPMYNCLLAKSIARNLDWDQMCLEEVDLNALRNGILRFRILHVSYATSTLSRSKQRQRREIILYKDNGNVKVNNGKNGHLTPQELIDYPTN